MTKSRTPITFSPPPPPAPDRNRSLYRIGLHTPVQPGTEVLLADSADAEFSVDPPQKWECRAIGEGQASRDDYRRGRQQRSVVQADAQANSPDYD